MPAIKRREGVNNNDENYVDWYFNWSCRLVPSTMTFGRGFLIVFAGFWGMFVLRQLGWTLSRTVLYTAGWPVCIILLAVWGVRIAFGFRHLVLWLQIGWVLKTFGYGAAAYVSIPNYGMRDGSSNADLRDIAVSQLSFLLFIIFSIVFAFTTLLKMAESVGAALLPFFIIYVAVTFSYALLNYLGRSWRPIFIGVTFIVVGIGAYAASFVTDMIAKALAGLAPPANIVRPCITWSLIAVCSLAICARRPVPFLIRAAPFRRAVCGYLQTQQLWDSNVPLDK